LGGEKKREIFPVKEEKKSCEKGGDFYYRESLIDEIMIAITPEEKRGG